MTGATSHNKGGLGNESATLVLEVVLELHSIFGA